MAPTYIDRQNRLDVSSIVLSPSDSATLRPIRNVGFVLSRGFSPLGLAAAAVFQTVNELAEHDCYDVQFVSTSGQPISGAGDVLIATYPSEPLTYDTLFVVGASELPRSYPSDDIGFLQRVVKTTRRMVASGTATFAFAEAGILDGFRATTHWSCTAEFRSRYPAINLDHDCVYVADRSMWTSAGMAADIDVALALVEDDLGVEVARDVARKLVVYYRRPSDHSQASVLLDSEPRTGRIKRVLSYARANLQRALSVEELADVAHLSPRQFSRLFRFETGQSPAKAIEAMRVEAAKAILKSRQMPIEAVAHQVGFTDRSRMRRALARSLGKAPKSPSNRDRTSVSFSEMQGSCQFAGAV